MTHPMGEIMPGKFFVFIEEISTIKRHTAVVYADSEDAAIEEMKRRAEALELPAAMTIHTERNFRAKPVRQGHGAA